MDINNKSIRDRSYQNNLINIIIIKINFLNYNFFSLHIINSNFIKDFHKYIIIIIKIASLINYFINSNKTFKFLNNQILFY